MADERNRAMEYWWYDNDGKTELTEEKSVQVPQSPQPITNGLEWVRTRFSTFTAQELSDEANARTQFLATTDEYYEEILNPYTANVENKVSS